MNFCKKIDMKRCSHRQPGTRIQCGLSEHTVKDHPHTILIPTGVPWDPGPAGAKRREREGWTDPSKHLPEPYRKSRVLIDDGTERDAAWFGSYWAASEMGAKYNVVGWKPIERFAPHQGAHTPAVDYWFTMSEWGHDERTGTFCYNLERKRRPEDRPGKGDRVWDWFINKDGEQLAAGTAQNQLGGRAAVRKFLRTMPDSAPVGRPK